MPDMVGMAGEPGFHCPGPGRHPRCASGRLRPESAASFAAGAPILRPAAQDTYRQVPSFSRHGSARAFQIRWPSLRTEGAGKAGCALHPRSRVPKLRNWRTRAYRSAETPRHSPRNGFTAYFVLSPVNGLVATVIWRITPRQLGASIAAPGPHDFAVRLRPSSSALTRLNQSVHAPAQRIGDGKAERVSLRMGR